MSGSPSNVVPVHFKTDRSKTDQWPLVKRGLLVNHGCCRIDFHILVAEREMWKSGSGDGSAVCGTPLRSPEPALSEVEGPSVVDKVSLSARHIIVCHFIVRHSGRNFGLRRSAGLDQSTRPSWRTEARPHGSGPNFGDYGNYRSGFEKQGQGHRQRPAGNCRRQSSALREPEGLPWLATRRSTKPTSRASPNWCAS